MTERERRDDEARGGGPRKIKVTDKRRVRPAEDAGREAAEPASDAFGAAAEETAEGAAADAPAAGSEAGATGGEPTGGEPTGGEPAAGGPAGELERARRQADEYLDHLRRLKAEFENYRKRVIREQTRAVEFASEGVLLKLLEVLDEFELALVAAEQKPDLEKFRQGVEMVYAKLSEILRSEGLERIEARGKPFDPERHEALLHAGEEDGEPYVSEVLRTGYTLKGKVLRPAGVKVARR